MTVGPSEALASIDECFRWLLARGFVVTDRSAHARGTWVTYRSKTTTVTAVVETLPPYVQVTIGPTYDDETTTRRSAVNAAALALVHKLRLPPDSFEETTMRAVLERWSALLLETAQRELEGDFASLPEAKRLFAETTDR